MYKKEHALLAGSYEMEPVEDYDYWLKLTDHCEIQYVPAVLMGYRVRSPYSISARLQNSVDQHRRWRYSFQLAKHNARMRRGIPFETTVIFIVNDGSEHTLSQYETILEQYYSNYKLLVVDISAHTEGIPVLQQVSDPRVTFIAMPSTDQKTAILSMLDGMNTPFTMLYGEQPITGGFYTFELAQQLRESQPDIAGVFYGDYGEVLHQCEGVFNEVVFNCLYRSDSLRTIIETVYEIGAPVN